jgi:hypothetical protein
MERTMSDPSLRSLAQVLHSKLQSAQTLDAADRASLEQLARDLHALLDSPSAAADPTHAGILDRMRDATTRFEVSHPELTATLSQIGKGLGDMGI